MKIGNNRVTGFGHYVRFGVGIDGKNVFRGHGPHPMLNRARNSTCDVYLRRDTRSGLPHLVGMASPTVVRYGAGASHSTTEKVR